MMRDAEQFLKNVYSQFGEDGIIAEIFKRIGVVNKFCFECGAADGKWFSNSRWLVDQGWNALLIEADAAKFAELQKMVNNRVTAVHATAKADGDTTLDALLSADNAPPSPDLGIIDVDGQDYYLFNSLIHHKPRVLIVEYDPNAAGDYIPERDRPGQAGLNAILSIGIAKGYKAVAQTPVNVIFIDANLADQLDAKPLPELRLNVGGGKTEIPGFVNIDHKCGSEAYPLKYADCTVDEIRASHILEHFCFTDVPKVLADWMRVLKPDGTIRIAVPDAGKIADARKAGDKNWLYYAMGGQTDNDDFHKSIYDEDRLHTLMAEAGFVNIKPWQSDGRDTSCHAVSLNLEGRKSEAKAENVKIFALVSRPRYGTAAFWDCINSTLRPFNIPLNSFTGVFWGQCMQRAFEDAVAKGIDWILTFDYDTQCTAQHLSDLMKWLGTRPEIDAIAALQCRRGQPFPLCVTEPQAVPNGKPVIQNIDGTPFRVCTAHFGMTLLRVDSLKKVAKPWFISTPDDKGEWGEGRMDDDIYFWHAWRKAGNTIYVAPDVRIGHVEEMVSEFDEHYQARHVYVPEWRESSGLGKARRV